MTGNAQRGAIAAAPYVFTIVFFVLWEAACRLFKIPVFFLPAPSVIAQASASSIGASCSSTPSTRCG